MATTDRPRRQGRRGSAVGLLNADDDNAYGEKANKYGKKKGSFLSRVKQNVGQTIEAAKSKKIGINGGMMISKSGHSADYSAEHDVNSDEWESDEDFENDDIDDDDDEPNHTSSFDQSFDFEKAFSDHDGQSKQLDVSQHSFFDEDFAAQSTEQSSDIKTPPPSEKVSKSRAQRRSANDSLLSRRLEDENLTKIKHAPDETSVLQFSPLTMQQPAPAKDEFHSEPFSVASGVQEVQEEDPFSKSEQFLLDADSDDEAKGDKTRKKVRKNKTTPSEKVMRRAQRRSVGSADDQNVGRSVPTTRKVRRSKSADDTPFDMSEKIDVSALVDSMKEDKKPARKRSSRSSKPLNGSSHHSKIINASSPSNKPSSSRKKKVESSRRVSKESTKPNKSATSPTTVKPEITQPSTLDVRF